MFDYDTRIAFLESQEALVSDKVINSIYPTLADLYIKSNNNKKAIEFLELAKKINIRNRLKQD